MQAPNLPATIYEGAFEYLGGVLQRIGTEEGQLIRDASGNYTAQYYLKDHLGSVRQVISETGTVLQETEYYPFGLAVNRTSGSNKYKFQGQEEQPSIGLYDFGNRMYDPQTGRMNTTDRFTEKYAHVSGYQFALNNPVLNLEINGDSIVVLSAPKGAHGAGHAAVLIGNDKTGWKLYSKNGTNGSSGSAGPNDKGDNKGNDQKSQFKTLEDFANNKNSPQTTQKTEEGKPEYQDGYLIASDSKTDRKMTKGAKEVLGKDYRLLTSSCIDVCSEALEKGGFDPGYTSSYVPSTIPGLGQTIKQLDDIPNVRYMGIKTNNKGTDVTNRILPHKK